MTGTVGIWAIGAILIYKIVPKIIKAVEIESSAPHSHRHIPIEIVIGGADDE